MAENDQKEAHEMSGQTIAALMQAKSVGELAGVISGVKDTVQELQKMQREDRDTIRTMGSNIQASQEKNSEGNRRILEEIKSEIKELIPKFYAFDAWRIAAEKSIDKNNVDIENHHNRITDLEMSKAKALGFSLGAGVFGGGVTVTIIQGLAKLFGG